MIDVESMVFSPIATLLRSEYSGIFVTSEYVNAPSKFPAVMICEMDNFADKKRQTSADTDRFAKLMYQVDVYSNRAEGKKSQCKEIMNKIDTYMYSINGVRTTMSSVPNKNDSTIYRITARYELETDGTYFYRR